jgi:lipopolysaccharide export system permease protein
MSRAFFYIFKHYIKNFLIVLFGMVFVVTLIDFLQHIGSISGANRAFLYFYYTFNNMLTLLYPIAMVFATIMTLSSFLYKNYLLVLSAFGYSRYFIIGPFIIASILIYFIVVGLNFTKFAYSGDKAESILNNSNSVYNVNDIFFKYNNSFVSAKEMDVVHKELKDVNLYYVDDKKVKYIMEFKKAKFDNGEWVAKDIVKKIFRYDGDIPKGYDIQKIDKTNILKGYYPKVVRLLYEGKRMSILDGFKAQNLLKSQNIDNTKIVSALLEKIIMPLFAPLLIVIIILFTPIHKRYMSRAKYFMFTLGITLIVWSLLYSLNMMSVNGMIPVYMGQPLIVFILFILTFYLVLRKRNSI